MKNAGIALMVMLCGPMAAFGADDAELHGSEMMNAAAVSKDRAAADGVKVLFLGNSITLHGSLPKIGWTNVWGMAASEAEKDYVHLVMCGIEAKTGRKADLRIRNLADFERNFRTWSPAENLKAEVAFDPDYLVIALGENVPNLATADDRLAYRAAFKKLLGFFLDGRTERPNTVVRGVFWANAAKDYEMAHVASDYAVLFVKADLGGDASMTAKGLFWHGGVQNHPGDKGMAAIADLILEALFPTKSGYEAWMDGRPVKVRPIRISAMPFNQWAPGYQRPMDQTEIAGMIAVVADGKTEFRVKPDRAFTNAVVRPLSSGVKPRTVGSEIAFTLPKPGYYVLELDGQGRPLEIFVEPKRDFSAERREANVVFGPGLHEPTVVKVRSHDRIYIDKDAVVLGSFQLDGVEDVKISGYGVISGSRNRRVENNCYRDGMNGAVRIIDSKKVVFDGPIVVDSACWMVSAFNSSDLEFSHLKVTGVWRYNGDGIDICNSQRVRIHDCYIHSFDDSIVLKGIWPEPDRRRPVEDIRVERCVCWCGWGRTLEIGFETWAPYYRGIVFEDCDLIHNCHGALSVHLGGPAPVEDVLFRNIRIEYDADNKPSMIQKVRYEKYAGKAPWSGNSIRVENGKMFQPGGPYAGTGGCPDPAKEPFGTFGKIRFEDIAITVEKGAMRPRVHIRAEPGSTFGKIEAENVTLNGNRIDIFAGNAK